MTGDCQERPQVAVGLDLGSTVAKFVRFDGRKILGSRIVPARRMGELARLVGPKDTVCTTGYFRRSARYDFTLTEISAARIGVEKFFRRAQVIIDLGGQDTKVIDLRANSLQMNDKCSAGTGAFLEQAAQYLGTDANGLSGLASRAKRAAPINSTCSVFALSEIISQMEMGHTKSEVALGLHRAFSRRIAELVPPAGNYIAVGGVALNRLMIRELSRQLGKKIKVPGQPQLVNALGAAIFALSRKGFFLSSSPR